MKDLIEALNILLKYGDEKNPTWCEHDVLHIVGYDNVVSDEDIDRLDSLGFFWSEEDDSFYSFKYGSC